jgi:hypothetical protein
MIVELSHAYLYPLVTMKAAAPDGEPPHWIGDKKIKKNSRPAVTRRVFAAGALLITTIFMVRV